MKSLTIVGLGNRGLLYGRSLVETGLFRVDHVFDLDRTRTRNHFPTATHHEEDFTTSKKLTDVVIIASPDYTHYLYAQHAIQLGYDILLEKPIGMNLDDIQALKEAMKGKQINTAVPYVLRYSPHFKKLKELIDQGKIGEIVNMQYNENVGYFHQAHSYVRGNWRNHNLSAPYLLAKSSHDLDMISFLTGQQIKTIKSFSSNHYFNKENFNPKTMANRCVDCPQKDRCIFSATTLYKGAGENLIGHSKDLITWYSQHEEYGRCVWNCDCDMPDHHVSIIELENGVHATLNISGFTNDISRTIKVMGTKGEMKMSLLDPQIILHQFSKEPIVIRIESVEGGHGGADTLFIKELARCFYSNEKFSPSIEEAIPSHEVGLS